MQRQTPGQSASGMDEDNFEDEDFENDSGAISQGDGKDGTTTNGRKRRSRFNEAERRDRRRTANRESARRMRQRRSETFGKLHTDVTKLQEHSKALELQVKALTFKCEALQGENVLLQGQLQQANLRVTALQAFAPESSPGAPLPLPTPSPHLQLPHLQLPQQLHPHVHLPQPLPPQQQPQQQLPQQAMRARTPPALLPPACPPISAPRSPLLPSAPPRPSAGDQPFPRAAALNPPTDHLPGAQPPGTTTTVSVATVATAAATTTATAPCEYSTIADAWAAIQSSATASRAAAAGTSHVGSAYRGTEDRDAGAVTRLQSLEAALQHLTGTASGMSGASASSAIAAGQQLHLQQQLLQAQQEGSPLSRLSTMDLILQAMHGSQVGDPDASNGGGPPAPPISAKLTPTSSYSQLVPTASPTMLQLIQLLEREQATGTGQNEEALPGAAPSPSLSFMDLQQQQMSQRVGSPLPALPLTAGLENGLAKGFAATAAFGGKRPDQVAAPAGQLKLEQLRQHGAGPIEPTLSMLDEAFHHFAAVLSSQKDLLPSMQRQPLVVGDPALQAAWESLQRNISLGQGQGQAQGMDPPDPLLAGMAEEMRSLLSQRPLDGSGLSLPDGTIIPYVSIESFLNSAPLLA